MGDMIEVGGVEAWVEASGAPQTWEYHDASPAIWGLSLAGVLAGIPALALLGAYGAVGLAEAEREESRDWGSPVALLAGAAVGGVVLGLGAWGLAVTDLPHAELVLDDGASMPGDSASSGLSILPSLAAFTLENGRTAWGLSLTFGF